MTATAADRPTGDVPWRRTTDFAAELRRLRGWLRESDRITRALIAVRDHLGSAPACVAYTFTLLVTWWTLRGVSDTLERRLILSASTNLNNMRHEPVQVLVASAFWTDGGFPWAMLLEFLVVMAAAERWLGTIRWILVFAAGHIGASMLIATGIAYLVDHRRTHLKIAITSDVGVSYGFYAVLAAMAFRFHGSSRAVWAGCLALWLAFAAWRGQTFTDYGHLAAMAIGFAIGVSVSTFAARSGASTV